MVQTAEVVRVDDRLMARYTRSEACHKCGACQFGREESRLYPLPEGDYREGDMVEIRVPDRGQVPAALLGYGITLGLMLIALAVANMLGLSELWQAAVAIAAIGLGYLLLKLLDPILRRSGRFACRVTPCRRERE